MKTNPAHLSGMAKTTPVLLQRLTGVTILQKPNYGVLKPTPQQLEEAKRSFAIEKSER